MFFSTVMFVVQCICTFPMSLMLAFVVHFDMGLNRPFPPIFPFSSIFLFPLFFHECSDARKLLDDDT